MAIPPPPPEYPAWPPPTPYGYPREHPKGTTVLVLGICSLVVCGLLGPFAWSMGSSTLEEIDENPMAYTNRSTVQVGRICGIIATVLLGAGVLLIMASVMLSATDGSL